MSPQAGDILVVDDEPQIARLVAEVLSHRGWHCDTALSAQAASALIDEKSYDVLISDIAMPDMSGLELLDRVVATRPETRVILMTGLGSSEWAKQAIRRGAYDYVEKPIEMDDLRRVVGDALRDRHRDTSSEAFGWRPLPPSASPPVLIRRDPLTGLINHRCFQEELVRVRAQCRRTNYPVTVLLIDVDAFAEINVKHGHAFGDYALRELARRLEDVCRASDIVARYDGQRFAIGLVDTKADQATVLGQRIRRAVTENPIRFGDEDVSLSVCIGIAESDPGFIESEADLIRRADQALSQAKNQGAAAVVCWKASGPPLADDDVQPDQAGLQRMGRQFEQLHQQLRQSYIESTEALVAAVEAKDPYTKQHSLKVATYAAALGRSLQLSQTEIQTIETAAILHDVGKIGIPDQILTKSGRLSDQEFDLIREHPVMAVQILQGISFLRGELPVILHHHEWWDGSGYPEGLSGESIPLGARILHVADSIEAMLARRSYKDSYDLDQVIAELQAGSGKQFDPRVVQVAVTWLQSRPVRILETVGTSAGN